MAQYAPQLRLASVLHFFCGEICQSIAGRGCEDGHRPVAIAGDGDHRRHLGRGLSGLQSGSVSAGREVTQKGPVVEFFEKRLMDVLDPS